MKAIFVSDVHLDNLDSPREHLFLRFVEQLEADTDVTHLYLLGDIFDLWIADYSYFKKKFASLLDALKRMHSRGVEIHIFEGNHDLYLHRFFAGELGFHVHAGPFEVKMESSRFYIEHGDQMDPTDKGYIFLRWFLRTPVMKWLAFHLGNAVIVRIGAYASRLSRRYTSTVKVISNPRAIETIRAHAQSLIKKHDFDFHISGHVHVPDDFEWLESGKRRRSINLGSWISEPWVLKYENSNLSVTKVAEKNQ